MFALHSPLTREDLLPNHFGLDEMPGISLTARAVSTHTMMIPGINHASMHSMMIPGKSKVTSSKRRTNVERLLLTSRV